MKRFAIVCAMSAMALLCSCTGGPRLIPKGEFARVYADMLRADKWIEDHRELRTQADTTLFYETVFNRHGYTTEDYLYSVSKYLEDPVEYAGILKQTVRILDDRIDDLVNQREEESSEESVKSRHELMDIDTIEKDL